MFSIPSARRRPQPPADSTLHATTAPPRAGLCCLKKINFLGSGLLTLSQWHKFRANLKGREDSSHLLKLPPPPTSAFRDQSDKSFVFLIDVYHQIHAVVLTWDHFKRV